MKIIILLFCFFFYKTLLFAQYNIVKNGDFKETEGNYLAAIKRQDIEFGTPKYWKSISPDMVIAVAADYDLTEKKFRNQWNKRALIAAQTRAKEGDILINLLTARKTERVPFSRKYVLGNLKYPLLKGKKYQIKLRLYVAEMACTGISHFGVKLEKKIPNLANKSAKEDTSALHLALNDNLNHWIELEGIVEAEGDEKYVVVGCFLQEEDLQLYQEYEKDYYTREINEKEIFRRLKRKKLCPEHFGQIVFISNISITALDSSEWALLLPKEDNISIDSSNVITPKTPKKKVQVYEKNYQTNFAKNAFKIVPDQLQSILNDLQVLEKKECSYHLYLTGHTDDEGSLSANEKLSKQRVEAVQAWLLEKNISSERITIDYKGEQALLGMDAAKNRRVEIRIEYRAYKRVLTK